MPDVLVATDADWIARECEAALGGEHTVHRVRRGDEVLDAVEDLDPALVLLDLQIGNMGGMAACLAIRQEEDMGRLIRRPVLLLLDREADDFLARRSSADGWMVKPIDPMRLARRRSGRPGRARTRLSNRTPQAGQGLTGPHGG